MYRVLVGKLEGKRPLGRPRHICFRILSLKTKDTSASSWLFEFVSYFLALYKNENICMYLKPVSVILRDKTWTPNKEKQEQNSSSVYISEKNQQKNKQEQNCE